MTKSDYEPKFSHVPYFLGLKLKIHYFKQKRRVHKLLAGKKKAEVLKSAPYSYNHWQGENGFRIYDDRDDRYLHFAFSSEEAELWILERYLCEINGLPDKPRGCHEDER